MPILNLPFHRCPVLKYSRDIFCCAMTKKYLKLLKISESSRDFKTTTKSYYAGVSKGKTSDKSRNLDWRDVVIEAEQLVGYPTPYLTLRSLFDDETAKTALELRKLICGNHPLLKSTKNLLFGSKYSLQSLGLMVLLTSKAAGFNTEHFPGEEQISGVLNSQRMLSEIIEVKRNIHLLHNVLNLHKNKDKFNDIRGLLCEKHTNLLAGDSSRAILRNFKELYSYEVVKLITKGLEDLIKSENLGSRNKYNDPMPSQPKGDKEMMRYFWEQEDSLKNIDLVNSETFLGRGKDEWMYRTMLSSGSILGKACQGAMMLAQKNDLESDAYILGSHLAILWQLHLDLKDFHVHPHSFSYVGAPVTIALWEYPTIYSIFMESQIEKTEAEHKQVYYAVRSTRAMDYITYFLKNEIETILEYSDKFPVENAKLALQKMAVTVYKEAIEYIE